MKVAPEVPEAGEPGSEASLSPLALTAGTPFMLSVHASLLIYIARRLANPRNRGLVFEFSDSTVQVRDLNGCYPGHVACLQDQRRAPV